MTRSNHKGARAFTLIELLVVITIIGVLIGLLLPAVQAAREAARRANCATNERNVALAMSNYESARKSFPGFANKIPGATNLPGSYIVPILPFMEHTDLYDAIVADGASRAIFIRVLTCPSDMPVTPANSQNAWTAYVCNRGVNGGCLQVPATPLATGSAKYANSDSRAAGVCLNQAIAPNGQAYCQSDVKYTVPPVYVSQDYVSGHDGSATTLLVAESMLESPITSNTTRPTVLKWPRTNASNLNLPKWCNENYTGSTALENIMKPTTATAAGGMEVDTGFDWGVYWSDETPMITDKVYSNHSGGFNVTFCDGHCQFLRASMDVGTYIHLMTPYDRGCPKNVADDTAHTINYCKIKDTVLAIPLTQPLDELDIGG